MATMLLAMMLDIAQNGCSDWVLRYQGGARRTCVKSRVSRTLFVWTGKTAGPIHWVLGPLTRFTHNAITVMDSQ